MIRIAAMLLLAAAVPSLADERILDFHADIEIHADGWIEVVETITVRAERNRIRRGIYRDQYTDYRDPYGNRYICRIEPVTVFRNGEPEPFHSVDIDRGIRTYFGSRDRFVAEGEHTYRYRYRADRMLGFFDDHDELYWNVTGFDWAFPIDNASARVRFAFDVPAGEVELDAYTGPYGSRGDDYVSRVDADGSASFEATEPLSPVNGLTIVVAWPKGYVREPTGLERVGWVLSDNRNLLVAVAGLVLLLIYYVPVWQRFGRDPDEGVLVTRYEPPAGYSPASLRYVRQAYYDNKTMTAAIVNLAVKGYLAIEAAGKDYTLVKQDPGTDAPALATGERELLDGLFAGGDSIALERENHRELGKARSAHKQSLSADYKGTYFRTNAMLNLPGIAIVLGTTAAALLLDQPTPLVIGTVVISFLTMVLFAIIMKRPTPRGRKLLDEVMGFQDYLEIAEKDEMNLRNPPEKTPRLFESYLPYALALGVDQEWSEKFAGVLAAAHEAGESYRPAWYHGSWNSSSLDSTTRAFSGGLNSAVAGSVSAPGSSSGSGGGGFSGGGGGGGGGGGW